jgi:hypothetical protein
MMLRPTLEPGSVLGGHLDSCQLRWRMQRREQNKSVGQVEGKGSAEDESCCRAVVVEQRRRSELPVP